MAIPKNVIEVDRQIDRQMCPKVEFIFDYMIWFPWIYSTYIFTHTHTCHHSVCIDQHFCPRITQTKQHSTEILDTQTNLAIMPSTSYRQNVMELN